MKKTAFLFSLLLSIVFASCKKDTTTPDVTTDTTPVTAHPLGYLKNSLVISISDSVPAKKQYAGSAYFYADSTSTTLVNIDSLSLNNLYLKKRTNNVYYTYDSMASSESKWHVQGANGVPVFDYTFAMPSYPDYPSLPDSVDTKKDLIVPLTAIQNFTKGSISITDIIGKQLLKEFKAGDTSVTFTSMELATLRTTSDFYFYLHVYNQQTTFIQGKTFSFENQLAVDKYMLPH